MSDEKPAEKPRDIAQELRDAEMAAMEFEAQIQRGEDDLDETAGQRRKLAKERVRELSRGRADVEWVLNDVRGRRVMFRILSKLGPNRQSFVRGQPDVTAFNEGMRAKANELIEMILDADASAYHRMQREHYSDLKSEAERKRAQVQSRKEK